MIKVINRRDSRRIRHLRSRKKVLGSADCPRISVSRSPRHICAQIVNDERGHTLVSASTLDGDLKKLLKRDEGKVGIAKLVGKHLASRALAKGVKKVVFDRSGYLYHGRIKALAEGARQGGLKF